MENNIKHTNLVYGIVGVIIGLVLTSVLCWHNHHRGFDSMKKMHKMPDGTMMMNDGSSMSGAMDNMMAGLEGKTGDAFDKAFIEEMIMHHEGAVVMAEAVLETSKRPELIKLANDIISAQTKEIEMMQTWHKAWFK